MKTEEAKRIAMGLRTDFKCESDTMVDFCSTIIKVLENQCPSKGVDCGDCLANEPCEDWHDVPSDEMTLGQARQAVRDLRRIWAKYLEQEPCEDCISRKKALTEIDKHHMMSGVTHQGVWNECVSAIIHTIEDLPPVTPTRKKGHWIIVDDCEHFIAKCSECGRIEDSRMISKYPYCHCGAEMESEG